MGYSPSRADIKSSTIIGGALSNTHQVTGSLRVSGSITLNGGSVTAGGGGGTPGGSNTQVQYNNAGAFAGSANFTFDGNDITVSDDTDASANIGRALIGYDGTNPGYAIFSHRDQATNSNYALLQRSDGTTILNVPAGGALSLRTGGNSNALVVAGASNNNIGINTGTPLARLHVSASSVESDVLRIDGTGTNLHALYVSGSGQVGIGTGTPDSTLEIFSATTQQKWSYDADSFATMTVADDSHTTITSGESGDITIDSAGDIHLQCEGGQVNFQRPGSSQRLIFDIAGGPAYITHQVDYDMVFRVGTAQAEVFRVDQTEDSLLMNTDSPIQFRDTATAIHSPAANRLAIDAPTVEVTGTLSLNGTDLTSTAAELNLLDASTVTPPSEGLWTGIERIAVINIGASQHAIGSHVLGVTLPDQAIITKCVLDVSTAFTSDGAALLGLTTTGNTYPLPGNPATPIDFLFAFGGSPAVSFALLGAETAIAPLSITGGKLNGASTVTFQVVAAVLTAGVGNLYVYYIMGT